MGFLGVSSLGFPGGFPKVQHFARARWCALGGYILSYFGKKGTPGMPRCAADRSPGWGWSVILAALRWLFKVYRSEGAYLV